jgi:hypothetical protein
MDLSGTDLSGIKAVLLNEFTTSKGLLFENHLYGCFTLLEQQIDSSAVALDCSFNQIGAQYGFLKDPRALYTGSEAYQSLWIPLVGQSPTGKIPLVGQSPTGKIPLLTSQQTDAFVDELEDSIFDSMRDSSAVFFGAALDTGELPEPVLKEALSLLTAVAPVKRRRLLHTKSRAPITPIKKSKHLSKTRRKPVEQLKLDTPLKE